MPSIKSLLSGLALSSVAANAAAIPDHRSPSASANANGNGNVTKNTFSVNQLASRTRSPRIFNIDYAKTLMKHQNSIDVDGNSKLAKLLSPAHPVNGPSSGAQSHEAAGSQTPSASTHEDIDIDTSPSATESGSVAAQPLASDISYIAPVTVGDSKLNLNFDTGSGDLWVYGKNVQQFAGRETYEPSSEGRAMEDESWRIRYADFSWAKGTVWTDRVSIGGVVARDQAVEVAQEASSSFLDDDGSDGLVGLSFSATNKVKPDKQKTFFGNVIESLDKPLFTVSLKHQKPGSYDFGFIDDSKHTGDIHYVPVDHSDGHWGVKVSIGNNKLASFTAIVDTGSTLILLDDEYCKSYYDGVKGAQSSDYGWTVPCDAELPDLDIDIGGYTATVPGKLLNWGRDPGASMCNGGLQSNDGGSSILGDVFLKSQFVVFEGGPSPRFGFAPQKKTWL